MWIPRIAAAALLAGVVLTTAGCTFGGSSGGDGNKTESPAPEDLTWSCVYLPTTDDDWHDDILCTKGAETQRPYLREGDDDVTGDELMESAREYEDKLNGL